MNGANSTTGDGWSGRRCALPLLLALGLLSGACGLLRPTVPAVAGFTRQQAERGARVYRDQCAACHGTRLNNGQFGAPLKGGYFQGRWQGATLAQLFVVTRTTMPPEQPGSLPNGDYHDVLAYLLQENGGTAGSNPLPENVESMVHMGLPW